MTKYFILENAAVLELDQGAYTLVTVTGKRSPFDDIYLAETATFEVTSKEAAAFLARSQEIITRRHFIYRDCGTGAGGFKTGNECSKGGGGGGDGKVEVEELEASSSTTTVARKQWVRDQFNEVRWEGCAEAGNCDEGMNDEGVEITDSQKEALFLYSGDENEDLLKSASYKWDDKLDDSEQDIGYLEGTVDYLRDHGLLDENFDYDGSPLDKDKFLQIQKGIESINADIEAAASETELHMGNFDTLYRGMSVKDAVAEQFLKDLSKDGATLDTESISSWTKNGSTAIDFIQENKLQAKIPILLEGKYFTHGVDMLQNESTRNGEEYEVVAPPSRFFVKRVAFQRSNKSGKIVGIKIHVEGMGDQT